MTTMHNRDQSPNGRPVLRLRTEQREELLSPFAARSSRSRGRARPEAPCLLRTEFQRDRDRIIHCKSFRRLKHKTQVFLAPAGDHYVTRLTHTLEVSQIARTIARALNLNEDLVEAMTLAHDMGHPPFGHLGERELDQLLPGGYAHAAQSLRIVDLLERDGQGLNLTWEVRQGILHHSKPRGDFLSMDAPEGPLTLEAQVCRISDAVAYLNHDILDAVRAGVLSERDLPGEAREALGACHGERIDTMVWDIVQASWAATGEGQSAGGEAPIITMSPHLRGVTTLLREFLFEKVYLPAGAGPEGEAATQIMRLLFAHYCEHPETIPESFPRRHGESPERRAADYLAGMTDPFAIRAAEALRPGIAAGAFPLLA